MTAFYSFFQLMTAFDSHPVWAAHKNFAVLVEQDMIEAQMSVYVDCRS